MSKPFKCKTFMTSGTKPFPKRSTIFIQVLPNNGISDSLFWWNFKNWSWAKLEFLQKIITSRGVVQNYVIIDWVKPTFIILKNYYSDYSHKKRMWIKKITLGYCLWISFWATEARSWSIEILYIPSGGFVRNYISQNR